MTLKTEVLFVLISAFALCYGWGMRGLLIGGERGAMLPGAMMGMLVAWFSGSDVIRENWWFLAAAGLMGMTFGGTEPYGETIGFALGRDATRGQRRRWGTVGLMLKGSLWFAVCGGFIAMAFAAMTGSMYTMRDWLIFFIAMPFVQQLGYRVFNTPYNKAQKKFPKIFFSEERREEWGSNVALLLEIVVFAALRGDSLTLLLCLFGFVFGGIGWWVAITFFYYESRPMKNGRYLFGYLGKNNLVEGWKTMEFTLGAFGGLGISLGFVAGFGKVKEYIAVIEANGGVSSSIASAEPYMPYIMLACVAGSVLVNVVAAILDARDKPYNSYVCDVIERLFYNTIPLCLVMLGSVTAARLMTFFMLVYAFTIKCAFERFAKFKGAIVWQVLLVLGAVAAFAGDFLLGGYSAWWTWFLCGAPYMVLDMIYTFRPKEIKRIKANLAKDNSFVNVCNQLRLVVNTTFWVKIAVLYAVGWALFCN